MGLAVRSSRPGIPAGGQARVGRRSIAPWTGEWGSGMMGFAVRWPAGSIRPQTVR